MNISLYPTVFNLFACYMIVLVLHFGYAAYVIKGDRFSLALGQVRTPFAILATLLLINGFSLSCFLWPLRWWIEVNFVWHLILTLDEILRTLKVRGRWPFLADHLVFALILWAALGLARP